MVGAPSTDQGIADLLRLARVENAYRREADQLDAHRMDDWCAWLHDDFRYEVPIPVTRDDPRHGRYSARGLLAVETKPTIELWVKSLSGEFIDYAHAENPHIRTRHFVTNVLIHDSIDVLRVSSNVLLSWNQRGVPPVIATAQRRDVLVDDGGELMLRERQVLLDSDVVHLSHLRVIF
jgi:3-phenylpropionate/cinnamic acid dioxygenase small subunit